MKQAVLHPKYIFQTNFKREKNNWIHRSRRCGGMIFCCKASSPWVRILTWMCIRIISQLLEEAFLISVMSVSVSNFGKL